MEEIHKDIKDFEELYSITSKGRVYSKRSKIYLTLEKSIQPQTTYLRVTLQDNGRIERFLVHRLVASHFIDNPTNKPCVNHIDNNGSNNSVDNIEWCTYSENLVHAQLQGRLFESQSKGGQAASAKVQAEIAEQVAELTGRTFGLWEVTGFHGRESIGTQGMFRFNMNVICTGCGTDSVVDKNQLLSGKSEGCVSCRTKQAGRERSIRTLENLKGTYKDHWHILDYYFDNEVQVLTCQCTLCGDITDKKKSSLIGRPMRKCKICKNK